MKFATLLREAGFPIEDFKKTSKIKMILYDEKDRIVNVDDIRYIYKLFINNSNSYTNFSDFLKELENNPSPPVSINVKIDKNSVVVFYKTAKAKIFLRN